MKTTELFRDQMGLSQEMMAIYLRVTRSQLSMYELGKRELPTHALEKLAVMAVFLDQNKAPEGQASELEKEQKKKLKTFLDAQSKELEFKKTKDQRLLDAMQEKYKQNGVLYQWAQHLQERNTTLAAVLMQQATRGMEQNGLLSQTKQKLKLETITSQLNYCQNLKET